MPHDSTELEDNEQKAQKAKGGAPYASPQFVKYGTIAALTKAVAEPGDDNFGGFPNGSTL